jgi:futalosine hydrolase
LAYDSPAVLIVCALRVELQHFTPSDALDILETGVGPVEAAIATAAALARRPYEAVINVGIGGAFRERATIGEAVLVVTDALADLGLEGGAPLTLPGGTVLIERQDADAGLIRDVANIGLKECRGVTVSSVTTTAATARRLQTHYGADIESMEGFSVLRAAAFARVPALQLRGVSNYVGPRADGEWNFMAGSQAASTALASVLEHLTRRSRA